MNHNNIEGPDAKRQRRTGWDAPTSASPNSAPVSASSSGSVNPVSTGGGMIGADLKAIIAAKIAAATSGGGATADPSLALACRIYVGSLYYDLTADDITALFEGFGEVTKCELQMDAVTGRSKGFCFLEFKTPEQAQAAMAMNGFEIAGRKIKVGRPNGGANGAIDTVASVAHSALAPLPVLSSTAACTENSVVPSGSEAEPEPKSVDVQSAPAPAPAPAPIPVELFTLVLDNMVSVEEARTNGDLKREVETEAARYGLLSGDGMCLEFFPPEGGEGAERVSVVLTYVLAKDAKRALRAMNGRLFDDRTVTASLR